MRVFTKIKPTMSVVLTIPVIKRTGFLPKISGVGIIVTELSKNPRKTKEPINPIW